MPRKGEKQRPEVGEKIGAAQRGVPCPQRGHKWSAEEKERLSRKRMGDLNPARRPEVRTVISENMRRAQSQRRANSILYEVRFYRGHEFWRIPSASRKAFQSRFHRVITRDDGTRTPILLARAMWEAERGPIPEGYVIHHRNGDWSDDRIENLDCMMSGEHTTLHNKRRKAC